MCSTKAGEDNLTVSHHLKVGNVDKECVEDNNNILGEDVEMSLAGENKSFDDLERAMDITSKTEKEKESRERE
jgi:hypothetical protein